MAACTDEGVSCARFGLVTMERISIVMLCIWLNRIQFERARRERKLNTLLLTDAEADRLLLYVVALAPASNYFRTRQISVSFLMRNPEAAQPSPDFAIEIDGENSFTPTQDMAKRPQYNEQIIPPYLPSTTLYNTAPLLISGLLELLIFQRTPSSGLSSVGHAARASCRVRVRLASL